MPRSDGRRRWGQTTEVEKEADDFFKFLINNNHPETCKRDELKTIYDIFKASRGIEAKQITFHKVIRELTVVRKIIHELGDYYSHNSDVQALFDDLKQSDELKKSLAEWERIAEENPNFCAVCGINCSNAKNLVQHQQGFRHRIHKLHIDIYQRRDQLVICPKGLQINSTPDVNSYGLIEKECRPDEKLDMLISLANVSSDELVFRNFLFLWETGVFKLSEKTDHGVRLRRDLQPGESYNLKVKCHAPADFGHHFVPLAFYFTWKKSDISELFFVLRFVSLHVIGDLHTDLAPKSPFKYPKPIEDENVNEIVKGIPLPDSKKNVLQCNKLTPSHIPQWLEGCVKQGITEETTTGKKKIVSNYLRPILDCKLDVSQYKKKFDTLLWIEELQMNKDIRQYDLMKVEMNKRHQLMILQVEGLAERRPSILRGDRVYIYMDSNYYIRYEGIVHKIECEEVHLGVSDKLINSWMKGKKYDVRFDYSRTNLRLQHRAVSNISVAEAILFPLVTTFIQYQKDPIKMRPWFDKTLNPEQQMAVTNIINGTSRPAPYLIFGPPGTGKTVTVTEAIRQVYHGQKEARILICCPENSVADFITCKLVNTSMCGPVDLKDIYRLYGFSRQYQDVPKLIKDSKCLNYDTSENEFFYPASVELRRYRILVITLSSCGRLVSADFPKNHFSHIFIDEGAHAVEPECIIPLTGLLDSRDCKCGQVVIAGDPRQLGPILRSPFSLNFGLDVSLIERLMADIPQYQRDKTGYNALYITKLVCNYRSHDAILEVPRKLFYDKELKECGEKIILNSMIGWEHLPNKNFPIIFHSVFGADEREKDSPSFFNRDEIAQVDKYLSMLLNEQKQGLKIKPNNIGIISPYRRQVKDFDDKHLIVQLFCNDYNSDDILNEFHWKSKWYMDISEKLTGYLTLKYVAVSDSQQTTDTVLTFVLTSLEVLKLREMVKKKKYGIGEITIGSVEEFQGKEYTVIIISTVRSNPDMALLDMDVKFHLGFIRNPKRFNVALTRARALLIVIGNPLMLEKDPNWKIFLDYCDSNNCYKGQHGKSNISSSGLSVSRTDTNRVMDKYFCDAASKRSQAEEPEWQIRN